MNNQNSLRSQLFVRSDIEMMYKIRHCTDLNLRKITVCVKKYMSFDLKEIMLLENI